MPTSPYVTRLTKELGMSTPEVEKLWDQAKDITMDTLGKSEVEFTSKEFQYAMGVVRSLAGVNENVLDPSIFLKSGKSAKEFIRETVVSANFSIGDLNPVIPPEEEKLPEEEDDNWDSEMIAQTDEDWGLDYDPEEN